jgi:hypothetical protein
MALIVSGILALALANTADAALIDQYAVTVPYGLCEATTMTAYAPMSVSRWAGDDWIAWQAVLWRRADNGTWAVEKVSPSFHYAQVFLGQVYTPTKYAPDYETFTITRRGRYALTQEVYSYSLRAWKVGITPELRVMNWLGQEYSTGTCGYGGA